MVPNGGAPIDFDNGFRVGEFEVYPKRLALVGNGTTARLEPKVMAVLVHLAQHADEVVTRNEFAESVWRGRIVSDEVLSRDVSILRSQLGDDAREPRYVMTIPRVGYRLIADVRPLRDPEGELASLTSGRAASLGAGADGRAVVDGLGGAQVVTCGDSVASGAADNATTGAAPRPIRWRAQLWIGAGIIAALLIVWLRPVTPPTLDPTKIAVLPFASLSESPDDEFFSDGLADEIMHALSRVSGIAVVARTSTFGFRHSNEDVREIGRKLNAGSLLEGSVRRDGNLLRVTTQMIDANTGLQVWSETYDRRMSEIFEIQNEISATIARKLIGALNVGESPAAPTQNIEAYTLFLRANHLLRQRGAAQLSRAVELFQQAIGLDPSFARAYAGLAEAYTVQPSYTGSSELAGARLATAALQRAEALGENPSRLSAVRGYLDFRGRQWRAAKDDFGVAIAANPNDAAAWQWYSQYLATIGWMQRARDAAYVAVKADPLSPTVNQRAGVVSLWVGDAPGAARYFAIAAEVGIERPGLPEARIAYLLSEARFDEARTALIETQRVRQQSNRWIDPALAAIAKTGSTKDALDALRQTYRAGELGIPMYLDALFVVGDVDGLYDAMPDVVASGEPFDIEVLFSETAVAIRRDRRFIPLMTQLKLVEFWDTAGWPDMCKRNADGNAVCS